MQIQLVKILSYATIVHLALCEEKKWKYGLAAEARHAFFSLFVCLVFSGIYKNSASYLQITSYWVKMLKSLVFTLSIFIENLIMTHEWYLVSVCYFGYDWLLLNTINFNLICHKNTSRRENSENDKIYTWPREKWSESRYWR